ncbi:MAG TPA: hypothetical protein VJN92_20255 [Candidatus Acidoferrum sp.]|nr:hypothetical protein [Candidatus Acidoferrum sp.]
MSPIKSLLVPRGRWMARTSERVAIVGFVLPTCVSFSGCLPFVPIKVSGHNVGANGERNKKVDLTFLVAGSTQRSEVDKKLGWLDTGFKNLYLYWGRFSEYTSQTVSVIGAEDRYWHERDVMIELDDYGIVKHWEILNDKNLGPWLLAWAARTKQPPLDPASNCTPVDCRHIKKVQIRRAWVAGDQPISDFARDDPDPAHFQVVLSLKSGFADTPSTADSASLRGTPHTSKFLTLKVDATAVYAFIRAQNQN